jgi:AcrR family transcriptional regulator
MRLFWRKGYTATSIADLTAAMGIGSPSLYAAFGSKEALYAEAVRHYAETAGPDIAAALEGGASARDAVAEWLRLSAAALPGDGERPSGCMVSLSRVGDEACAELGRLVLEARRSVRIAIEARLRRGAEAGDLPPTTDFEAMARFYQAVHQGMSIQARDGATAADLAAVADGAMAAWDALTGQT